MTRWLLTVSFAVIAVMAQAAPAQTHGTSPYRLVEGWAHLPEGREMGALGKVVLDPDGAHLWAIVRCDTGFEQFGRECRDSDLDPVLRFDLEGNLVASFGAGMFIWPHGLDVDGSGNVWVTEAVRSDRIPPGDPRGHRVIKFSPRGDVLMILGTSGEEGGGPRHFTSPSDVAVAPDGTVFVADGHNPGGNDRIATFAPDGTFLGAWGGTGWAPGELRGPHTVALDGRGRVWVGDRGNNRIQIFHRQGTHQATWTQFGRPSGIAFDGNGLVYVADADSDATRNPGWEMGIRIGSARTGWVHAFIPFLRGDPAAGVVAGAEFVAVDADGTIYAGEPVTRRLQKYVRVRR